MSYKILQELITGSSSSRQYFLSLPAQIQMELHNQNQHIHNLFELHRNADYIINHLNNKQSPT